MLETQLRTRLARWVRGGGLRPVVVVALLAALFVAFPDRNFSLGGADAASSSPACASGVGVGAANSGTAAATRGGHGCVVVVCALLSLWRCWPHCLSLFLIEIFHLVALMLHHHHLRVRAELELGQPTRALQPQLGAATAAWSLNMCRAVRRNMKLLITRALIKLGQCQQAYRA